MQQEQGQPITELLAKWRGGDNGDAATYRKGTLYFYNNTVVSTRSGNTTLFRLSTNDETCDARNNIFYNTAAGANLALLAE